MVVEKPLQYDIVVRETAPTAIEHPPVGAPPTGANVWNAIAVRETAPTAIEHPPVGAPPSGAIVWNGIVVRGPLLQQLKIRL
jgi:hypothetical protein